jgi:hypothetical protein
MPTPSPHPLDEDDDFKFSEDAETSQTPVSLPLLRWSMWVAVGGFVAVFLSAVASNNFPANSAAENLSIAINRFSSIVLLVACCSMLLAYRLPYLQNATQHDFRIPGLVNGFSALLIVNVIGLALIWAAVLSPEGSRSQWMRVVLILFASFYAGLMATMAIWHKNFLRAYAVGVLTVLALFFLTGWQIVLSPVRGFGGPSPSNWPLGIYFSVAVITGLVCAGYVQMLAIFRPQEATSVESPSDRWIHANAPADEPAEEVNRRT